VLHSPSKYESVSYRLLHLLHWSAAVHWTWISAVNERLNFSAATFEWLTTPLFMPTRGDRLLFLLNFLPYLLWPGLFFSVYQFLREPGRVTWAWMWILPAKYCYAVQTGRIANDALGAVLLLTSSTSAIELLERIVPWTPDCPLLAIALSKRVERSNLPLVLPCFVALWPA
jgi:hypothetical protein